PVFAKMADARIGWARVDFNWPMIEPAKDSYDWALTDGVVDSAQSRSVGVLATLAYTPGWANGDAGANVPPDDLDDWRAFVTACVTRYKGKVRFWSIWNEPTV